MRVLGAAVLGSSALPNGLGKTPPMGWSTWMTCADEGCTHDYCNEKEVKEAAQALIDTGMQKAGYNYVNLDDCWAYNRSVTDDSLTWDPVRFPSGIPALTDWLHDKGLKFGLYTSAGNETCSRGGRPIRIPGSRGHYEQDAETFASWGVDYVKFDWCGDIYKQIWEGAKAHKDWAAAMLKASRPMFLEVVAGFFFLQGDIANYTNSWRFCEDHQDHWGGQYSTVAQLVCRADQSLGNPQSGPGGWSSMDLLHTGGMGCKSPGPHCPGEGQTDESYRTAFTLWSLTQSPLIVDTDIRNMTAIMKEVLLNQELIDIHQSTVTPPGGLVARPTCLEVLACQVWARKLAADGSSWLVALVNLGEKPHKIAAEWQVLGWESSQEASSRDLWAHKDGPSVSGKVQATVPPHGAAVYKLTKASDNQLLV
mmetsp:Transcript_31760/g.69476  ORF Transcript_31760/g.69476 Transcript_31760/m.69476 type:complete len:422 (-) Transcript_31760:210-1475(-)|eukprot:CAMPEP_0204315990 /NCGR_PEP_ID=MMETSP0469-20131031/5147_1 /ASSEMBLY_ACC=CAM_ASM_000384 /TAXON_ID=2969 /ORGANISM="Oxyrrhis marina" /LENGTH=421 /DNA_ID=CAMNT_0051296715 /DNA_START=50 /DNA_END=1315 /DNA_ORIENTATION=+